jgi:DNA-binding transcriptional LysR family regulator
MAYYQLWHARTHQAPALRWLREQVRDVARELAQGVAT